MAWAKGTTAAMHECACVITLSLFGYFAATSSREETNILNDTEILNDGPNVYDHGLISNVSEVASLLGSYTQFMAKPTVNLVSATTSPHFVSWHRSLT